MKILWGLLGVMIALSLIACDDAPQENPAQKCKCSNPCTIVNCTCPYCPGPAESNEECKCSNPCTIANCTCPDCPGPAAGGEGANISINFGDETFTLNKDVSTTLSQINEDSISIELSKSFTTIRWIINGEQIDELNDQTAITLNAADLSLGNYSVTAMVSDGISWYSRTVTFTVGL